MNSDRKNTHSTEGKVRSMSALSRREFLGAGAAGALLGTAGAGHAARAKDKKVPSTLSPNRRPNVIILLTDDQGYGDMSCHGNPVLRTPNMDRLHAESVRLTDFHVAPMCTPTRSQLLTGLDALHNAASSVCAGRSMIRPGIPTMAEIFRDHGYRTALFGKWHLGDSYPNLPHFKGFEESVYHLGWGITSMADLWENDYFDGRFRHNGVLKQYKGYCTDVWFDLSMNWIRERAAKNEPFFLYLPTNAPHGPHWVPQKYAEPYRGKGPAEFFGMIANIDENLGRLQECLKATGQWDNTIFIFMNDNGGTAGVKIYNAGMRASKTQYYDGGHRAACFVRWPAGALRPVGDVDVLTQVQDILPTLMDLCGLKKPDSAQFDGISLAGLLRGATNTLPDRMCVVQYGQEPKKWECAVLWNKWRLVRGEELYDLKTDFGQKTNVAAQNPDVLKKMRDYYERWWAGVEPRLYDFVPIIVGADQENPVTLSAADWANVYCDNMRNLREGLNRNSQWHILAAKDGQYEIGLRRWPKEADAPIAAGVPAFKAVAGELPEGKALPIVKARLKIGDVLDETKPVAAGDKEIRFSVALKAGTKTEMQSWFYDANGGQLCGAYFAYVTRR
ncbi:MAG: arylsulfatase [Candidatus Sumerlaeia bacterium]|nr:arylsulfatase [Candidatus Sumerlaeia bacterium]